MSKVCMYSYNMLLIVTAGDVNKNCLYSQNAFRINGCTDLAVRQVKIPSLTQASNEINVGKK